MRWPKKLIEQAYTLGAQLGLSVWCEDEAGPFQAVPHPGVSWQPRGRPATQPHEYIRSGTTKILTLFHPASGQVRLQPAARGTNAVLHPWVDSSGRRNTAYVGCSEELVESLGRCSPAQGLSRPAVEGDRHGCKVLGAVHAEVGALREVLAQQPVGVLVRAALPGAVRVAEVDRHASLDPELGVLGHFRSLIPGQRSSQLFG